MSDKTIQRAIRAGVLAARYPQPNRCEIAVSDLEAFKRGQLPEPVETATESRLVALEARVQQLEHLLKEVQSRQETLRPQRSVKVREHTTGPLPKQFVPLLAFARDHCVAESKVQTHANMGLLPVKRGEWIDADGTVVTLALDVKGKAAFYQLYRSAHHFTRCHQCSHGYLDTVSGQA